MIINTGEECLCPCVYTVWDLILQMETSTMLGSPGSRYINSCVDISPLFNRWSLALCLGVLAAVILTPVLIFLPYFTDGV